jgi:hypothetical protein
LTAGNQWPENPSFRFILHRLLRRDQLCPKPMNCAAAQYEDPYAESGERFPCFECPLVLLNRAMEPRLALFGSVIDIDFAVKHGIRVSLDEISYLEFGLMRILQEERNKFEIEQESNRRGR